MQSYNFFMTYTDKLQKKCPKAPKTTRSKDRAHHVPARQTLFF